MTPGDWVNGGACEQSDSAKTDPLYKKCQLYSDKLSTSAVRTEKQPRLPHLLCLFFLFWVGGGFIFQAHSSSAVPRSLMQTARCSGEAETVQPLFVPQLPQYPGENDAFPRQAQVMHKKDVDKAVYFAAGGSRSQTMAVRKRCVRQGQTRILCFNFLMKADDVPRQARDKR